MMPNQQLILLASHAVIYNKMAICQVPPEPFINRELMEVRLEKETPVKADCLTFGNITHMYCWFTDVLRYQMLLKSMS